MISLFINSIEVNKPKIELNSFYYQYIIAEGIFDEIQNKRTITTAN